MCSRTHFVCWTVVIVAIALLGAVGWQVGGPIRSHRSIESINDRTRDDVIRLIGPPIEIHGDDWLYTRTGNPGWLSIGFDETGRVESIDHEYGLIGYF